MNILKISEQNPKIELEEKHQMQLILQQKCFATNAVIAEFLFNVHISGSLNFFLIYTANEESFRNIKYCYLHIRSNYFYSEKRFKKANEHDIQTQNFQLKFHNSQGINGKKTQLFQQKKLWSSDLQHVHLKNKQFTLNLAKVQVLRPSEIAFFV